MFRNPRSTLAFTLVLALLGYASSALAEDRPFCADRPGLGTPPCTLAPGEAMVEIGLAGWDHLSNPTSREDDLKFGDSLMRVGVDARTEIAIGFGGFSTNRTRDLASGALTRASGPGDVTLAVRRGLAGPNGPAALHVFATVPTGAKDIGEGDWTAGVLLPVQFDLPAGLELAVTPEFDLVPNSGAGGHHGKWGGSVGIGHDIGPQLSLEGEVAAWRDDDPAGGSTDARAALSLAWQAGRDWQLDVEIDHGLTAAAPRLSLSAGLAHRF